MKHNWERIKMDEGRVSVLQGVPRAMPALQRAQRIQERASRVGFDWKRRKDVWKKVQEEMEELRETLHARNARRREEEFGDFLFALVNYARFIGVNPEQALRGTTEKFTRRFQYIERAMKARGEDIHHATLERMDEFWNEAKRRKKGGRRPQGPAGQLFVSAGGGALLLYLSYASTISFTSRCRTTSSFPK